ncbi:MAG: transposase, partial [Mariprofundaceae bacterium]
LVERAEDWRWSSVGAHLSERDDELVKVAPVLDRYGDFGKFLAQEEDTPDAFRRLRQSETSGRPLGDDAWMEKVSAIAGKDLKPKKRGPKAGNNN